MMTTKFIYFIMSQEVLSQIVMLEEFAAMEADRAPDEESSLPCVVRMGASRQESP